MPAMNERRGPSLNRGAGFTLIEAMIVVTVLGILAMIAFPSYSQYVVRANRAVAKSAVMRIAGQQESFFTDRKQYATSLAALSPGWAATMYLRRDGNFQNANSGAEIYAVTLTAASSSGFTVQAAPVNGQAKDTECGTLNYNSTGLKSASTGRADCWSR
jgi:type IV pilus assembly protein PilE